MPPPAGLEPGTAVFKKCTTADETLPCGQKMTKGDFAVALRWLERIPVGGIRSGSLSKTMTRRNRSLWTRLLLSGCSIRVQKKSRRRPSSRRHQSSPFGPWYSEPAHHHHVGRERRGRAPSSCSDVLRRRGAVALSELVASVLIGFDVDTSGLISFSFVFGCIGRHNRVDGAERSCLRRTQCADVGFSVAQ